MGIRALALAALIVVPPAANAEPLTPTQREAISQSVELFDRLKQCMAAGDFERYGFAPAGPCGDWMADFVTVRDTQDAIQVLGAGYECIAGEAYNYGGTFFRANRDAEWREQLEGYFDACREALR